MELGLVLPVALSASADPGWVRTYAQAAEALGFAEISVVEHAVVIRQTESKYPYSTTGVMPLADDCDIPDPLELLTFIAASTERIGLATGVLVLPNHHPVVLAKRLATVDRLSGGRLRATIGVGWMREEIEACGGDFDNRGRIVDESIEAMRTLWAGNIVAGHDQGVDFHGTAYHFERAICAPKPVQPNGIPIFIGGHSRPAARRAARLGNGFQPLGLVSDELRELIAFMRQEANDVGRDGDAIEVVLGAGLNGVNDQTLADAMAVGAARILLSVTPETRTIDEALDQMADCSARLGLRRD